MAQEGNGSPRQWAEEKPGKKPLQPSSNSPTAALPPLPGQKRGRQGKENKEVSAGDHERVHLKTERERRRKMRDMFSALHSLLPNSSAKANKSSVVDEAINYIKNLQNTLQKLQKQKLESIRERNLMNGAVVQQTPTSFDTRESFLAEHGNNWAVLSASAAVVTATSPTTAISMPSAAAVTGGELFPNYQTWSSPNVVLSICGDEAHINVCSIKKPGLLNVTLQVLEKHKLEVVSAQVCSDKSRFMCMVHAHARNGISDQQYPETLTFEEIFKIAAGEMIVRISSLVQNAKTE